MITIDKYQANIIESLDFNATKIRGEKWLSLLDAVIDQDGDSVTVTSTWQVENLNPEINNHTFAPFIHVYDETGERIQIVDGRPIAGTLFREGDLHIHQMQFELDGDVSDYRLELGQYDGLANLNLILITDDGEYLPTVEIVP